MDEFINQRGYKQSEAIKADDLPIEPMREAMGFRRGHGTFCPIHGTSGLIGTLQV